MEPSDLISEAVDISIQGAAILPPNRDNPFTGWIKKQYDGNVVKGEPSEILVLHPNGSPRTFEDRQRSR